MKYLLFFILSFFSISLYSQKVDVQIYYENSDNGYYVYADNNEYCPSSVKIIFDLENLKTLDGKESIYVIPQQSKKHLITELKVKNPKKGYKFSFKYSIVLGDHTVKDYDEDFLYYLPFKKSNTFSMDQGYDGDFSHQNINALDFTMPVGTELTAIRDGIVVRVVEKNSKHCEDRSCAQYANNILIYHSDGTFSDYVHIKKNGSKMKVGDKVKQGQHIGYSGNVGWTTGPHLHIEVFLPRIDHRETLKTKFLIDDGKKAEFLKVDTKYSRDY